MFPVTRVVSKEPYSMEPVTAGFPFPFFVMMLITPPIASEP